MPRKTIAKEIALRYSEIDNHSHEEKDFYFRVFELHGEYWLEIGEDGTPVRLTERFLTRCMENREKWMRAAIETLRAFP